MEQQHAFITCITCSQSDNYILILYTYMRTGKNYLLQDKISIKNSSIKEL